MLISKLDNIFIAGHKGLLGKALLKNFKLNNYENLFTCDRSELDLFDYDKTKDYLYKNNINVVILAAAKVGGIRANINFPSEYLLENIKIQNNVIESAWRKGIKRLLFIGSSCIYPKYAKQPIKEEELLSGYLESSLEPYALAKISGIKLCEALRHQYGFDAICLMPSNMYGPGDNFDDNNSHVLASLIRRFHEAKIKNKNKVVCWGSGNVYREFLFSEDCADACRVSLENWDPNSKNEFSMIKQNKLIYLNVGTGKDLTIRDLAIIIAKEVGYQGKIVWDTDSPDGTPRKLLDINRIKSLGWNPNTSLEEGISITYKEFLKAYANNSARL